MLIKSTYYSFPYIFFLLLIFSNCLTKKLNNKNSLIINKQKEFFCLFYCLIFIGFRGFIFTDWTGYYKNFDSAPILLNSFSSIKQFINTNPFEKGYSLYVVILKTFSFQNYIFFQLFDYVINLILLWSFLRKYSNNTVFSYLFYFLFWGFMLDVNLQRNIKAVLIILNSIRFIERRKIVLYICCIMLAMTFHITAIIYIVLFFLYPKKINRRFILSVAFFFNVLYLAKIDLLSELLILCSKTIVTGRFGILLNRYVANKVGFISTGITIGYLERLATFLLVYFYYHKLIDKSKMNTFFCNVYFVYYFLSLFCSSNLILFERVVPLFIFPYWILYPYLYKSLSLEKKKIFLLVFLMYSILKLLASYNTYLCYYDNQLFLPLSATDRLGYYKRYGLPE